ncbi:hypothetical protein P10VF_220 [Rhizobium phage vB_RleM_P10VF]|uniref:Uncharacterized protein n=1 Tax=Rhizobium phage vB_RleM_P10VF TaxID=1527770 RepID=A0A076YIY3_9CAUD|nr:hypothetical protein P10VF_220 [Rhizobium phage vB_RleM_P10VF]AIK68433.1 hypothetical protein P10VF_220 [Rhizobium phage vB_RleM_P10VF]
MGYTNRIHVDPEVTKELLEEYVDTIPEDEQCPYYIEGAFPSAASGTVINNSGSYGASGSLMRPFCHGIAKFLMERGYSCEVDIETYGFVKDLTRYDAETQTISKIEENEEYNGGYY